jgi:hypothetical protein
LIATSTMILALLLPGLPGEQPKVAAAKPAAAAKSPKAQTPPFPLRLRGGVYGTVDIQAVQIETRFIAERLREELKIPVQTTAVVGGHKVDVTLKDAPLGVLLSHLAPVVLADIEVVGDRVADVWRTIHLVGYNEKSPPKPIEQVGFLVAAGITDDPSVTAEDLKAREDSEAAKGLEGEERAPEKPSLSVSVQEGRVSVRARKQLLAVLLNDVASRAAIAFDIRGNVDMVPIDIEIRDLPLVDLPLALGRAGVRVVIRKDLNTGDEVVHGIRLGDALR